MPSELHRKLLERAAEIVGGKTELCRRLDVDRHALEFWLSGRATPPEYVFLAAADLVLADDLSRAGQDRRKQQRDTPPADGASATRPARL